ncbi:hypothetical protein DFAR_1410008 [Desulfarculales bacterium]
MREGEGKARPGSTLLYLNILPERPPPGASSGSRQRAEDHRSAMHCREPQPDSLSPREEHPTRRSKARERMFISEGS